MINLVLFCGGVRAAPFPRSETLAGANISRRFPRCRPRPLAHQSRLGIPALFLMVHHPCSSLIPTTRQGDLPLVSTWKVAWQPLTRPTKLQRGNQRTGRLRPRETMGFPIQLTPRLPPLRCAMKAEAACARCKICFSGGPPTKSTEQRCPFQQKERGGPMACFNAND